MIIDKKNSEHYKWGNNCDGWKYLDKDNISIIREKMPPNTSEITHYHKTATQFFYILQGIATLEIEDETFTIKENEGIEIAPLKKHKISNQTKTNMEFILISQPTTKNGDRIEQ